MKEINLDEVMLSSDAAAAWYSITRYLKEQKLIENDIARGDE
mgnify:CR=1 FL=1